MSPHHLTPIRFFVFVSLFLFGIACIVGSSDEFEAYDEGVNGTWRMVYQTGWDGYDCLTAAPVDDVYMEITDDHYREYLVLDSDGCDITHDTFTIEDGRIIFYDEEYDSYADDGLFYEVSTHNLVIYDSDSTDTSCEEEIVFERIDEAEYWDLKSDCDDGYF